LPLRKKVFLVEASDPSLSMAVTNLRFCQLDWLWPALSSILAQKVFIQLAFDATDHVGAAKQP